MADHLVSIYGTERDKVNCPFFYKMGACRHGDKCSKKHIKPTFSQTVLLSNFYLNPALDSNCPLTDDQVQQHFDLFYEDIFTELALQYGEIEEMHICDNVGDHLIGNVYVRFFREKDASYAVSELNKRFYAGRPLAAELSPVLNFRQARCKDYESNNCTRGGFCNFMHIKSPSEAMYTDLMKAQAGYLKEKMSHSRSRSRSSSSDRSSYSRSSSESCSRSRSRSNSRSRSRSRSRSNSKNRSKSNSRSRSRSNSRSRSTSR